MKEIGVYIHIPFCLSKCFYCDFVSFSGKEKDFEAYTNALVEEIKSSDWLYDYKIKSIFFGGGTPSILPDNLLQKILDAIYKFNVNNDAEITIECNPETVNKEKFKNYKKFGFNRLSFGLQAYQNSLLKKIGRAHSIETFLKNYNAAIGSNFANINIDLIFAIPEQTMEMWSETVEKIVELNPSHISAYSLIVEENTNFGKLFNDGKLDLVDEEADRNMYKFMREFLSKNNYVQYEISNFSKVGKECVHNKIYWQREEYIGFGLSAHSFVKNKRFSNTSDLNLYLEDSKKVFDLYEVTETEAIEEFIFLGLRMTNGINRETFKKIFNKDIFEIYGDRIFELVQNGFLVINDKNIYLSEKGIDVSNLVFSKILT